MADTLFFGAKSIGMSKASGRKPCDLLTAAAHNLREIEREQYRYNPAETAQNEILHGPPTAAAVQAAGDALFAANGIDRAKLRHDHVQAVEFLFSPSLGFKGDLRAFFVDCLRWAHGQGFAVLSFIVHHDEGAPHAHCLVSPIKHGILEGSRLIERSELRLLRQSFWGTVAGPHGLTLEGKARMTGATKKAAAKAVLARLQADGVKDAMGLCWDAFCASVEANPRPYVESLGLATVDIVGKPHRVSNPNRDCDTFKNDSGFESAPIQSLSCVGFAHSIQKSSPKNAPHAVPSIAPIDEAHGLAHGDGCAAGEPDDVHHGQHRSHGQRLTETSERLRVARAAELVAIAKHKPPPPPPESDDVDGIHRERDAGFDVDAWTQDDGSASNAPMRARQSASTNRAQRPLTSSSGGFDDAGAWWH